MDSIIEGMQILRKYDETCSVGGEHDVIFCGFSGAWEKVGDDDKKKLSELGWRQEEKGDDYWQRYT